MTPEHKQKMLEANYEHHYGPDWRNIVAQRKAEAEKAAIAAVAPKPHYADISKSEFLGLLVVRLRDPAVGNRDFIDTAKLYAEVKKWSALRTKIVKNVVGDAKIKQEALAMAEKARDASKTKPVTPESLAALVKKLEEGG
jgi:hypothetical protein